MINAHQAEIIAVLTEHGEILHRDHVDTDEAREAFEAEREQTYGLSDYRFWQLLEELQGYTPLSRYSIGEEQGYRLESDVDYYLSESIVDLTDRFDELKDAIFERIDDDEPVDKDFIEGWLYSNLEGEVICDQCGEVID